MRKVKNGTYTIQAVDASSPIVLTVEIGAGQLGSSGLNWQGSTVMLAKGKIKKFSLGNGSDINGKVLKLYTNVLDANIATNKAVVTYTFENGSPSTLELNDVVDNDGDILSFVNMITFN